MDHWRAALGSALYEIIDEDMLRDHQRTGAPIAAHCVGARPQTSP
jgi:hypothetical protein